MSTTVTSYKNSTTYFLPKRVVIVSKQSKLEYEINRFKTNLKLDNSKNNDDIFFLKKLEDNTYIKNLKKRHAQQQLYVDAICDELKKHKIEYEVVFRQTYTNDVAKSCDLIISAGGDGTFLLAASKVHSDIPVIGINTDPIGSEGYLCLNRKSNRLVCKILQQFFKNEFKWTYRQRIRVSVIKSKNNDFLSTNSTTKSLSDQNNINVQQKNNLLEENNILNDSNFNSSFNEIQKFKFNSDDELEDNDNINHKLALNEVFIGESHAARVSYYDVQLDDGPLIKQKSSGMTICTGTGSTSWHYNINRLTEQNFCEILQIANSMGFFFKKENDKENSVEINESVVEEICKRFNEKLIFEPSAKKMAFSIRDPVFNATFPKTPSRGFAQKIRLKSRCTHAHLIMDGSTSIPFNNGTEILLEIYSEDALKTAVLL